MGAVGSGGDGRETWEKDNTTTVCVPLWVFLLVEKVDGGAMELSRTNGRGDAIAISIESTSEWLGVINDVMLFW